MPAVHGQGAQEKLHRLQTLTDAALAHLSLDEMLDELLERVRELLDADTAAVLLLDPSAEELVATAAKGIEEEVRQGVRIPLGQGFAGRVAVSHRPLMLEQVNDTNVLNPILLEKGIQSLMGAPLIASGSVLGVVHVGTLTPRRFTEEDAELLQLAGDRAALAISAHLSNHERAATAVLQRSLLPERLPTIRGLQFAARYVPGEPGNLGGDWYDVLLLSPDLVGLTIGDVVGHGLRAAVVMGRFRSALRAYAIDSDDPAVVLSRLDTLATRFEPNEMATALYGVLDRTTGTFRYATAGHPPPVLAVPNGEARLSEVPTDPPIGTGITRKRHNHLLEIPPDATMYLYTDGLVERRGDTIDRGLARLRAAAEPGLPDVGCSRIMKTLLGSEALGDDCALLAVRRHEVMPAGFELLVPARPTSLATVRAEVRRWLRTTDATADDVIDLLVAIGEACANSIEHAYGASDGKVSIRARIEGSTVEVSVADRGTWRAPQGQDRGRGMTLMRKLTDNVTISRRPEGTEVTMQRRIGASESA